MSGSYIGSLVYRITGDTSGIEKSLSETKGKTESFGSHIGGWATKVAGMFAAAFTIEKIVEFDKKLLEVASHSNEVSSRFANTFPNAINKANASVQELTDSYGYSTTAAKESMSATGGLLATLGMNEEQSLACSEQVAKLGADLASYTDFAGGAKGAADALTKAMLGETDSAKSLSLSIGDDALSNYAASLGKSTESMSTAEKAQLRLNLAMSQASAMGAVGDMIKTANGYANTLRSVESKMEDAEARAGQRLIPNVTQLAKEFGNAVSPGGAFAGMLDTVAEAGAQTTGVLSVLLSKLNEAARASATVNDKRELELNKLMLDSINEQINANGGLAAAKKKAAKDSDVAQLVAEYEQYTGKIKELEAELKDFDKQDKEARRQQTLDSAEGYRERIAEARKRMAEAQKLLRDNPNMPEMGKESIQKTLDQNAKDIELYSKKLKEMLARENVSIADAFKGLSPETKKHTVPDVSTPTPSTSDDLKKGKKEVDETVAAWEKLNDQVNAYGSTVSDVMSSVSQIVANAYKNQIDSLDEKQAAEEQAAGVSEETAIAKAQREYDLATKSGNKQLVDEKKKALLREQIEEKYARKKADLQYKQAVAGWEFQVAQAAIQTLTAPLNAYVSTLGAPYPISLTAPIMAGLAATSALAMDAAIISAKPQRNSFEVGGIVPGSSYSGDKVGVNVNSAEMIINQKQQRELWQIANGGSTTSIGQQAINIYLGNDLVYSGMYNASVNGDLMISNRAITSR